MKCFGRFFAALGAKGMRRWYRCQWDGVVIDAGCVEDGEPCPNCSREVKAVDLGEMPVKRTSIATVDLPDSGEAVIIPGPPVSELEQFALQALGIMERDAQWGAD